MTDRSDFKPLQVLPLTDADKAKGVVFAATCVADAMTMRRSVIIRDGGDGSFSVHERIEAGEGDQTGALAYGSYDLTLSEALTEAARRIKREEGYVAANAAAA